MKNGSLSQYFDAVVAKTLRTVEVDGTKSHQHEFNGTRELREVIRTSEAAKFNCRFMWIKEENESITAGDVVTWYNARLNQPRRSAEYRLYFHNNPVMELAKAGDIMFLARRTDGTLLIIVTPAGGTVVRQLYWLFNLTPPQGDLFSFSEIDITQDKEIDFAARYIMEEIGVEIAEPESEVLDKLIAKFSGKFPSIIEFSAYARATLPVEISIGDDPDGALLEFMNWEEKLFRRLEKQIIGLRLKEGFMTENGPDVEGFIKYSLSVQNRRKARAGSAFEDHINYIFLSQGIHFSKGKVTEDKAKPDFLFPHVTLYKDAAFPADRLTMLGVKTSLKDRWRQVLAEAARIPNKHLLTLEPSISEDQTAQMRAQHLQLVVPKGIQKSFSRQQQEWLMSLKDFTDMLLEKQKGISLP